MKKRMLVLLLCFLMCLSLLPVSVWAATTYSSAAGTWNEVPRPGATVKNCTLKTSTDTSCLEVSSGSWEIKNGDEWENCRISAFVSGTYRYVTQLRCRTPGDVLDKDAVFTVDGAAWTNLYGASGYGSNDDWHWYASPEYTFTTDITLDLTCSYKGSIPENKLSHAISNVDLSGYTDGNPPISFEKQSGPSWIKVSANGKISGTPDTLGANYVCHVLWLQQPDHPEIRRRLCNGQRNEHEQRLPGLQQSGHS